MTPTLRVALAATAALALTVSATAAHASLVANGSGSVVRVSSTVVQPTVTFVDDTAQYARDGVFAKGPGGELAVKGDYFGTIRTNVSGTGTCETRPLGAICDPVSRVELRFGPRNDFLLADWYDAFLNANYWTSKPVLAWMNDGDDSVTGGRGNDQLYGGLGSDDLNGSTGNDVLDESTARATDNNYLYGEAGNDTLRSRNGVRDELDCGAGNDLAVVDQWDKVRGCETIRRTNVPHLRLIATGDDLRGTPAADRLTGTKRPSTLSGEGGNDRLKGRGGADRLTGGKGNDTIIGGPGKDTVFAGPGKDVVKVRGGGKDLVRCGPGRDTVVADRRDTLIGCEVVRYR